MANSDTNRPDGVNGPYDGDGPVDNDGDNPFADDDTEGFPETYTHDADEHRELDLDDDDESRLPWLDGDDEEYEEGGTGQLIAFVLAGLVILGLLVGGIWWFTRDKDGGELVADGSVIEAPEGPFKERPEDPGGKTFEGTGDSSFAVSEGQTRPAQLGTGDADSKPGFETTEDAGAQAGSDANAGPAAGGSKTVSSTAASSSASSGSSGVGVQVGAFTSRQSAENAWSSMSGRLSALDGVKHRILEGQADIGKVYRLQAVASDVAAAKALCGKLDAAGQPCMVKN